MNDINKKNTPNQMRIFLKRMRDGKNYTNESQTKTIDSPKKI